MTRTTTGDIVGAAATARTAACSFNVIQLEHVEAIIAGAERSNAPVILQVSHNAVRYHGNLAPIGAATVRAAESARVPVAVHLDHAQSEDLVRAAVDLGFDSVMFDASASPYAENLLRTKEIAEYCHRANVWVEAELGEVGGKDGVHAPGARTKPAEAVEFVAATGVDALAVAVGTSHAMLTRDASLDFDLIAALAAQVPVPLVLHGSSGVSDDSLRRAVAAGMTKINIATQLNKVFTAAVRQRLADDEKLIDPRRYLGAGRDAVATEVARMLDVLTKH